MTNVINNISRVVRQIGSLNVSNDIVEDDGSVIVNVLPSEVENVINTLRENNITSRVGDGVQWGSVWIHDGVIAHEY